MKIKMHPSQVILGMGLLRDGVAGRFLEEEVGQKIWAKKGTSLQPAGCQPPLHRSYKRWCKCCTGEEWYYGVWAASINPSQSVHHCCPGWPEPRTLTGGEV